MAEKQKIVVAVTGASGSIYAKLLLEYFSRREDVEVGLVLSKNAPTVWEHELGELPKFPFRVYDTNDFMAPFASGSARFMKMVIIPCSMGTLGRIAGGISDDLVTRAADVMLKERRQLICVTRDTPLSMIHIKNMLEVTQAGGVILPASPSFYSKPQNFEQLANTVVHRVLDMMGFDVHSFRWNE